MASGTFSNSALSIGAILSDLQDNHLNIDWETVTCPICLDFPHNAVLLQCSSYDKGCRPFMCDTDHTLSNCLERFKRAHDLPTVTEVSSTLNSESCPACPLCRGEVTGWFVIDKARDHLDVKKRCCEENRCSYVGNFLELRLHAHQEHPDSRPSEIDPARKFNWEILQQSSEIIDVLSTIHSEVPHGVVWGDYVIEYGEESGDEYEDFRGGGEEGNWWTSCILYQVFDNFRASRNRRRTRGSETRRGSSGYEAYLDEVAEYQFDESDDEFMGPGGDGGEAESSSQSVSRSSYLRHRAQFHDS